MTLEHTFALADSDQHEGWMIEASGTVEHDPDDMCDPCTTTYVVRATDELFLFGLDANLNDPTQTIEKHIADYLADYHQPGRCGCAHDCCGHRHGHANAAHISGPLYIVRVHTSRNY
jgi:hypothetical protein